MLVQEPVGTGECGGRTALLENWVRVFGFLFCLELARCPWANDFSSPGLIFFINKMKGVSLISSSKFSPKRNIILLYFLPNSIIKLQFKWSYIVILLLSGTEFHYFWNSGKCWNFWVTSICDMAGDYRSWEPPLKQKSMIQGLLNPEDFIIERL